MSQLHDLLVKTSRTFALSIPELPEPTRSTIGLAYLLFRVADTLEDSTTWPRAARLQALGQFCALLHTPSEIEARRLAGEWSAKPPCDHSGYLELIRELPAVMQWLADIPAEGRKALVHHTCRTAEGMAEFVAGGDESGRLRLDTLDDLRRYCYTVAGIVGEMITDVFLIDAPALGKVSEPLRADARAFGEGLQLVNILRDRADDARDGRVYLPSGVDRASVFDLARRDLERAASYVLTLQRAGAPRGFVGFTALPVRLALTTLQIVEREGPGAKVGRAQVGRMVAEVHLALALGRDAVPDPARKLSAG